MGQRPWLRGQFAYRTLLVKDINSFVKDTGVGTTDYLSLQFIYEKRKTKNEKPSRRNHGSKTAPGAHPVSQRAAHLFRPGAGVPGKRLPAGAGDAGGAERPDAPGGGAPGLHFRHGVRPRRPGLSVAPRPIYQLPGAGGQRAALQPAAP